MTLYLAGGCFWGVQRFIDQFPGVVETVAGFANGRTENPSYRDVCDNNTGHAETVKVVFDETVLPLEKLLSYYFLAIDPLSVNRQGEDEGTQYRTGIYFDDPTLLPRLRSFYDQKEKEIGKPLAVELLPLQNFYPAEEYHQKYLVRNPTGYCHLPTKLFCLSDGESKQEKS